MQGRQKDAAVRQLNNMNFYETCRWCWDDVGTVHRGLEVLGITGYVSRRDFHNAAMRKGFAYLPENDCFTCMKRKDQSRILPCVQQIMEQI